ncbi:hypothetical protein AK812_SmicGene21422 [Symbiodinium microadriaticum]|uniref:Uncharacterized protein n=1 Tax=Symbiodinium microadriaticum TaxID=2951 RepID=A0A1Q9DMD8_SYMMI|nr:hypothetical protein AK812_SmicGene21422 [Symbiodinium microadriaticum]
MPQARGRASPSAARLPRDAETLQEQGEASTEELKPRLRTRLHLTGTFADWKTSFALSRLVQVPKSDGQREDVVRLKLCVKLTSQSFSFQVVSPEKDWSWRLYPRDAQPMRQRVAVAVGDLNAGHGLNFHVVEKEGDIVTVWVEVPVQPPSADVVEVNFQGAGARVWYTLEDTGVQYTGGDGVDLDRYKWMTG